MRFRETTSFKRQIPPTPFSKGGVGVCLRSNIQKCKDISKTCLVLLLVSNYGFVGAGFLVSIHCHLGRSVPLANTTHINLKTPNLPIIESIGDLPIEALSNARKEFED
jgi:hypothetical protein